MFGNGETMPAQRIPDYGGVAVMQEDPQIVHAAKDYEDARRCLQHLQAERDKIEETIKQTIHRQEQAAARMIEIIQAPRKGF